MAARSPMSGPRLTLVIPRLFESFRQVSAKPRLSSLETLLARATSLPVQRGSYEARLFTLFGTMPDGELPVGAVRRIGEGAAPDESGWYCAEPVHLLADRDRLHLVPARELHIEATEAAVLAQQFNAHFAADGWHLEVPHPERWYLRTPSPQSVRTTPLSAALSQDLRGALPSGPDALRWHRFLNEVQMLFHGNAINETREQHGLLPINGLWPWGGGRAPRIPFTFGQVWADEPTARGLARLSGAEVHDVPPFVPPLACHGLAVIHPQPEESWWLSMERRWFAPAQARLAAGELEQLTLEVSTACAFRVGRAELRRWWRRRRPVESFS